MTETQVHYGASPDDWSVATTFLDIGEDLLPVVANPHAQKTELSKVDSLGKTPTTYNHERRYRGIADWTQKRATAEEIDAWSRERDYGICIQTRNVRAIDVDISDPAIVAEIAAIVTKHCGALPRRGRANSVKCLFAVRIAGVHRKREIKIGAEKIEFLADGQMFVACGTHPSGARYAWDDGGLPYDVPSVDAATFDAMWSELEGLFGVVSTPRGQASTTIDNLKPPHGLSDDEIRTWLDRAPAPVGKDYDTFQKTGCAIHHETEGEGYALWVEWSQKSPEHDETQMLAKWASFGRYQGAPITFSYVKARAKESEAASKYKAVDEWKAKVSAVADEFTLRERMCAEIAKDDRLDELGREALAQSVAAAFKRLGTKYPIGQVRRLVAPPRAIDSGPQSTHDAYARRLLAVECERRGGVELVGVKGKLYGVDPDCIWRGREVDSFINAVTREFDGQEHCETRAAYKAIAEQAYGIAADGNEDFFADAPVGLPHAGLFHHFDKDGAVVAEKLTAGHRQRYEAPAAPIKGPMPLFEGFLRATFEHEDATEVTEQIAMVQEVCGAVVLGLMAPQEKVVLLHGPGRAGKGTMLKIIESLVNPEHSAAISPFKWDHEYYLAELAGKLLNVVGELPENQPINSASFKGVTGRDLLQGRHPNHRTFPFRNEAAHVFNSNHFVVTTDRSEAFFTRWLLIEFRNSLIGRPKDIEDDLAKRIVTEELPAILAWSLEGAQRLRRRRSFQITRAHRRLMDRWRVRTDPIVEFLRDPDACLLASEAGERTDIEFKVRRLVAYEAYTAWCTSSNRKPVGKLRFNDEIESPAVQAMGVKVSRSSNERETLRGVHVWHPFGRPRDTDDADAIDLFESGQ